MLTIFKRLARKDRTMFQRLESEELFKWSVSDGGGLVMGILSSTKFKRADIDKRTN